jgi:hypothetical protein
MAGLAVYVQSERLFDGVVEHLDDLDFWNRQNARLEGTDLFLVELLKESVSYWKDKQGYTPKTERGVKGKIHNAISFHLERWEERRRGPTR